MTARKALWIVLIWGVTFACVGGLIGATLGVVAPDYYRSVFRDGRAAQFNPFQVGIGLGVTQGLASGVAMALGVLTFLAWRDLRSGRAETKLSSAGAGPRPWARLALWGVATAIFVAACSSFAFVAGGILGQQQLYQTWTDRKLERIATILESNEFPNVRADYSSAAQVFLIGSVDSNDAKSALCQKLVLAFGTEEAEDMIRLVDVSR